MKGTLSHIELNVNNLARSKQFWGWFLIELGYKKHQEWDNGASYRLEETYIVLVQVEDKYKNPEYHRKRVGLNHLAFHAGSKKSLEDIRKKLIKKEITFLYDEKKIAPNTLYFEDPDRIKVELAV